MNELQIIENKDFTSVKTSTQQNQKTMTTKELATVLGVSERTIRETAKTKGVEGTFHTLKTNGGNQSVKVFTEEQATLIKQEIQKHHNLATRQIDSVSTQVEENQIVMKAMAILQNRNNELMAQLNSMQPKVDFYNKVTGSPDTCDMKEVAKLLNYKNVGRNKLFEILRDEKILDNHNQPYQKYIDAGYFRVIETKFEDKDGDTHINLKTVVFQKGVDYIKKTLDKLQKRG